MVVDQVLRPNDKPLYHRFWFAFAVDRPHKIAATAHGRLQTPSLSVRRISPFASCFCMSLNGLES